MASGQVVLRRVSGRHRRRALARWRLELESETPLDHPSPTSHLYRLNGSDPHVGIMDRNKLVSQERSSWAAAVWRRLDVNRNEGGISWRILRAVKFRLRSLVPSGPVQCEWSGLSTGTSSGVCPSHHPPNPTPAALPVPVEGASSTSCRQDCAAAAEYQQQQVRCPNSPESTL